ncbi:hypothetical protein [Rivularia sp. PCC 7116]|uniref:hypothetical protein n=1 Tax=Rivularia sp. PCC 7116 TaxID=373994 RepID=UPI0018DEE842|nr:hypothetical protein [Rivularia sp. PCC 7116]
MSSAYKINRQQVNATPNSESIMGVVERLTYHFDVCPLKKISGAIYAIEAEVDK